MGESEGELMKYDFSQFYNFGHYGIFGEGDALYPEVRGMLKEALVSDEDFNTGWGCFKKEIESIRIQAIGDTIIVSVCESMDDIPDLIYDCDNSDDLTDDEIDELVDYWDISDYKTYTYRDAYIDRNSSLKDILKVATKLINECHDFLEAGFKYMQTNVDYIRENRR